MGIETLLYMAGTAVGGWLLRHYRLGLPPKKDPTLLDQLLPLLQELLGLDDATVVPTPATPKVDDKDVTVLTPREVFDFLRANVGDPVTGKVGLELYGYLRITMDGDQAPAGYCHFPQYDGEFFKQLTAEHLVTTRNVKTGREIQAWHVLPNRPNHFLDCRTLTGHGFVRFHKPTGQLVHALLGQRKPAGGRVPAKVVKNPACRCHELHNVYTARTAAAAP